MSFRMKFWQLQLEIRQKLIHAYLRKEKKKMSTQEFPIGSIVRGQGVEARVLSLPVYRTYYRLGTNIPEHGQCIEVEPCDPRLPKRSKDNLPWVIPANLVVKVETTGERVFFDWLYKQSESSEAIQPIVPKTANGSSA